MTRPTSRKHRSIIVDFIGTPITTTVTSKPSVVRRWLEQTIHSYRRFSRHFVVGVGVQWTPDEHAGTNNPAATLQLCIGRRCLIFQLIHSSTVPRLLRRFLLNPSVTFVGFWNHSDGKRLMFSKHVLEMFRDPLDLRHSVVSRSGLELHRASIERIVEECVGYGVRFEKWISNTDWEEIKLSDDQIDQACYDARAPFVIGKDIRAWRLYW